MSNFNFTQARPWFDRLRNRVTLRQWLTQAKFDFAEGRIIYHPVRDNEYPGYSDLWGEPIPMPEEILDQVFRADYEGPECPRFIAEDSRALYFPYKDKGRTGLVVVYKNLDAYTTRLEQTPYPGSSPRST